MRLPTMLTTCWLAALLLSGSARSLELWVDPGGGPLNLEEVALQALEDWRSAGADPDSVEAVVRVSYGEAGLFGDDVLAWLLLRPEGSVDGASAGGATGSAGYEILLNPDLEPTRAALIPAFGVILGGSLGSGSLDPHVDPEQPRLPTAAEAADLVGQRSAILGDLNGDGQVDFEDLLLLAAEYGRRGLNLPADLDRDGLVGDADLDLLRAAYTFTGPAMADPADPDGSGGSGGSDDPDRPDGSDDPGGSDDPATDDQPPAEDEDDETADPLPDDDEETDPIDEEPGDGDPPD